MSLRLQHLQWGGGLAAALGCLALGAMSLVISLNDYRRVRQGMEAFARLEDVADAMNAIVAERAPTNQWIIAEPGDAGRREAVRRARAETDRLLALAETALLDERTATSSDRRILQEVRDRLAKGRRLADAVVADTSGRPDKAGYRSAVEALFEAAGKVDALRDTVNGEVLAATPEISAELFLNFVIGAMRDQAGRLGSYVVMMQRERGADGDTKSWLDRTVGRLESSRRGLHALAVALPGDSRVRAGLAEVERHYFEGAMPFAIDVATAAENGRSVDLAEFAAVYVRGLARIDGLREAIAASSQFRLAQVASDAFRQAILALSLTVLVCLILLLKAMIFRRALFAPLGRAREQAIAIARGDLSMPEGSERIGGEVGAMLAGLEAIRDEQRWRRRLEEQQAEMARELKRLAETDTLTGLLNRRALELVARRSLEEADRTGEPVGLILFDIDHFKLINDTFGHVAGDDVLRAIGRELGPLLRPRDRFARIGGEEFMVLMAGVGAEEARAVAERLRERLPALVSVPDRSRRVTASFGVAVRMAGSSVEWPDFVATADRRLYAAKRSGRDRVCQADAGPATQAA